MAPTTSSQNGSTPKPGIASRASPGNSYPPAAISWRRTISTNNAD
jgi:hypothetical protein